MYLIALLLQYSVLPSTALLQTSSWSQNRVKHQNTKKEVKQESKVRISQANLQTSKSQSHITLIGRSIPIDHRSPYFFFSCHRSASNLLVRTSDANFGSFLIKIHSERWNRRPFSNCISSETLSSATKCSATNFLHNSISYHSQLTLYKVSESSETFFITDATHDFPTNFTHIRAFFFWQPSSTSLVVWYRIPPSHQG